MIDGTYFDVDNVIVYFELVKVVVYYLDNLWTWIGIVSSRGDREGYSNDYTVGYKDPSFSKLLYKEILILP